MSDTLDLIKQAQAGDLPAEVRTWPQPEAETFANLLSIVNETIGPVTDANKHLVEALISLTVLRNAGN